MKKFILEERGCKCERCGCGATWQGKPMTLHVHHRDGNSDNNEPSNLEVLCPNCHSQTDDHCKPTKKKTRRNKWRRDMEERLALLEEQSMGIQAAKGRGL